MLLALVHLKTDDAKIRSRAEGEDGKHRANGIMCSYGIVLVAPCGVRPVQKSKSSTQRSSLFRPFTGMQPSARVNDKAVHRPLSLR